MHSMNHTYQHCPYLDFDGCAADTLTIALRIAQTLLGATSVSVMMDTSLILTITRAMVGVSFEVFGVYLVSQQTSMSVKRKQQSVMLIPHAAGL